ncbi:hypothetical protein GIB67_013345, partial [Kingdonia uniflora]
VPQPENFHNATLEQQRATTIEEVLPGDRNFEQGAGEYCPRDPSLLTSFATHRAKVLVHGQVVWDPYLEKREDKHNFKEVASFTGLLCSPEHNEPYYPDRVQRQFNRMQPVPRAPTCVEQSGLHLGDKPCAYKPKYNWVDLFSEGKWRDSIILTRGRKVHDGIPVCTEGYFEWFNSVSSPNFAQMLLILLKMMITTMGGYWGIGVVFPRGRMLRSRIAKIKVVEDPARLVLVEALAAKTGECAFFIEANLRMQADIQAKDIANSIYEKKLNEKTLECESNKKLVKDLRVQLADKVKENETLSNINDKLMEEVYVNQEARPLPVKVTHDRWYAKYIYETERLGVWHLTLKGTIKGGDFEDTEDPT